MATHVQQYRLAEANDTKTAIAVEVAQQIKLKQYRLMDLILSIGEDINSPDATARAKVVEYLGAVLAQLESNTLSRQDISLLVKYLCARIENDRRGVRETAQALRTLVSMSHFTKQDTHPIVQAIFASVTDFPEDYFSQVDTTRLEILKLMADLLEKYESSLQSLRDKFIDTLLACAARESRAKNLMIWFTMIHFILSDWDVSIRILPIWEKLSMYFPITMNPVALASEKAGVTVEELKQKLRDCISATPLFAPRSINLLLDKLKTHTAVAVKKDILLTLKACAQNYAPITLAPSSEDIWNTLKYEIFNGGENELPDITLDVLQSIAQTLSADQDFEQINQSPLRAFIKAVVDECFEQRNKEEQTRQIISAIEKASFQAYHLIAELVLPKMFMKFYATPKDAVSEREEYLKTFHVMMKDRIALAQDTEVVSQLSLKDKQKELTSFAQFATQLFNIFEDLLESSNATTSPRQFIFGVQGTTTALVMAELNKDTVTRVARRLANGIVNWEPATGYNVYEEIIRGLELLTAKYTAVVAEYALPILEAVIPDDIIPTAEHPSVDRTEDWATSLRVLECLSRICMHGPLIVKFHDILLGRLKAIGASGHIGRFANILLSSLLYNLKQRDEMYRNTKLEGSDDREIYKSLVTELVRGTLRFSGNEAASAFNDENVDFEVREDTDDNYLALVGRVCAVAVGSERFNSEQSWIDWGIWLIRRLLFPTANEKYSIISPSSSNITSHKERAIIIVTPALASLKKEAKLGFDVTELANSAIRSYMDVTSSKCPSVIVSEAKLGFMALLVNKWNAGGPRTESPQSSQKLIQSVFSEHFENAEKSIAAKSCRLAFSYVTAALMKMDRASFELLDVLMQSLSNQSRGQLVASSFQSLLAPSDILTTKNHATIRLLYRQSTFNYCLPRLIEGFSGANDSTGKADYLLAIMGLLKHSNAQLILPYSEQLMPVLMAGLGRPETDVMSGAVKTLAAVFRENSSVAEEHARSIVIKSLTGATSVSKRGSADLQPAVRANAVDLVTLMAQCLPLPKATQLRPLVVQHLHAVKDSPYRVVRASAVACHSAWFPMVPSDADE